MRHFVIAVMATLAPTVGVAQPPRVTTDVAPLVHDPEVDRLCSQFFDGLKGGNVDSAFDRLLGGSTLWASKAGDRQALSTQVKGAVQVYGPVRAYELVHSEQLGGLSIKRYYLVQQEKMVTRWEVDFVRVGTGWTVGYFGFDDQVKNWF